MKKYAIVLVSLFAFSCQTANKLYLQNYESNNTQERNVRALYFENINKIQIISDIYFKEINKVSDRNKIEIEYKKLSQVGIPISLEVIEALKTVQSEIVKIIDIEKRNYILFQLSKDNKQILPRALDYKILNGKVVSKPFQDTISDLEKSLDSTEGITPEKKREFMQKAIEMYDYEYYRIALPAYYSHYEDITSILLNFGVVTVPKSGRPII